MQRSFKAKLRARARRQSYPQHNNRRRSSVENVVSNIMRIEDFRNHRNNAINVTDDKNTTKDSSKRNVTKSDTGETEIELERFVLYLTWQ